MSLINTKPSFSFRSILQITEYTDNISLRADPVQPDVLDIFLKNSEQFEKIHCIIKQIQKQKTAGIKTPAIFISIPDLNVSSTTPLLDLVAQYQLNGIILRTFSSLKDLSQLSIRLSVCETRHNLTEHSLQIIACVSRTQPLMNLISDNAIVTKRLIALSWNPDQLSEETGYNFNSSPYTEPRKTAEGLFLLAAAALKVRAVSPPVVSSVSFSEFQSQCIEERLTGYQAKYATTSQQVPLIHDIFSQRRTRTL